MQPPATIHILLDFLEEDVRRAEQSKFYNHIGALDPRRSRLVREAILQESLIRADAQFAGAPPL